MKKVITTFASVMFIMLISVAAFAGTGSKVIAVINHATWCPACQENGERAQATFMENNKDGAIQFIANNLSNDETKAKSAEELKKAGLDKKMSEFKGTGVAYFFDAESKELINYISVTKSNEELALAVKTAKKGAE